jgi:hypothetical protein
MRGDVCGKVGWRELQLRGGTVLHHRTVALAGLNPTHALDATMRARRPVPRLTLVSRGPSAAREG